MPILDLSLSQFNLLKRPVSAISETDTVLLLGQANTSSTDSRPNVMSDNDSITCGCLDPMLKKSTDAFNSFREYLHMAVNSHAKLNRIKPELTNEMLFNFARGSYPRLSTYERSLLINHPNVEDSTLALVVDGASSNERKALIASEKSGPHTLHALLYNATPSERIELLQHPNANSFFFGIFLKANFPEAEHNASVHERLIIARRLNASASVLRHLAKDVSLDSSEERMAILLHPNVEEDTAKKLIKESTQSELLQIVSDNKAKSSVLAMITKGIIRSHDSKKYKQEIDAIVTNANTHDLNLNMLIPIADHSQLIAIAKHENAGDRITLPNIAAKASTEICEEIMKNKNAHRRTWSQIIDNVNSSPSVMQSANEKLSGN